MPYRKKLIEVALPLEAINKESAREKSIRHGHPSTLHLWWARRPLAACRAVIFAQMVDDPSGHPELFSTEEAQEAERQRLFRLIEELVKWENINNEELLAQARAEIVKSAGPDGPPPLLDPFCGGGSIPLEAQRLGLEAHGSDLNPVAVLITKALIEIPPKFAGCPPVNPEARARIGGASEWKGAAGLAEDVRYYGKWMRDEAEKRIGHLYPKVMLPAEYGGGEATVIAWLWARTVKCPNPACGAEMPLVTSFWLSQRKGQEAWIEPVVDRSKVPPTIDFSVRMGAGKAPEPSKIGQGARFRCLACGQIADSQYIKDQGIAHQMRMRLIAIVAEGMHRRLYLPPTAEHEEAAQQAEPDWQPNQELSADRRAFTCPLYGLNTFGDLFTPRQLVALNAFSDLVIEARERVQQDAVVSGLANDNKRISIGGTGASGYADSVATYLALSVSKAADLASALCHWQPNPEHLKIAPTFSRHSLAMVWDFAEGNPFSESSGNFSRQWELINKALVTLPSSYTAVAEQRDAASGSGQAIHPVISTDPPYYDNVPYADLSDFFYVWLRRSLHDLYPLLFSTLLVPKGQELVADPTRHGDRSRAERFFEEGLNKTFSHMCRETDQSYPLTVYYAFKQAESDGDHDNQAATASTGWEAMLEGLVRAGFAINGTWPMRTERPGRLRESGSNALASSIVLVCRTRAGDAPLATRRDFLSALKRELPEALKNLQRGNIAPVDLAQASIGPGMAIYSRYSRVLEADGSAMRVRTALALINQALDEYLAEQEGDYDADTRWAVAWFEQFGFNEGPFGDAETLSKAKVTSVEGMVRAGIVQARGGKVRLLRREELPADWDPAADKRLTVWEVCQHLIRTMQEKGEPAAAGLLARVGGLGDTARDLAYRLYTVCERKGWAQEALPYNSLVVAWSEVGKLAEERRRATPVQGKFEL